MRTGAAGDRVGNRARHRTRTSCLSHHARHSEWQFGVWLALHDTQLAGRARHAEHHGVLRGTNDYGDDMLEVINGEIVASQAARTPARIRVAESGV
jgi:hypothetical protein